VSAPPREPTTPPQDLTAEVSVLGAMLQDLGAAEKMLALLQPCHFYRSSHAEIFEAIRALMLREVPPDLVTVANELVEQKRLDAVGGAQYLALLVDQVPTAANILHHADIVRKKAGLRLIAETCKHFAERAKANGSEPADLYADLWEQLRPVEPGPETRPGPVLLNLSHVSAEEVTWLWPGRIPIGKLCLVVGDPGLGKSFLTLDFAARISRGAGWPDGEKVELGDVVLLSAEDGVADTIRSRSDRLDGDPQRLHVLVGVGDPEKPGSFNLARDVEHLEDAVLKTRARLVVIDPLSAYLGGIDSHRDADVRGILAPLAAMAERNRVAVVSVVHMNKSQQRQALYRAQGSLAFVAAARAVFGICEDQENPGRRLFVPLKMNLAPKPPTLAFRIDGGGLAWADGSVDVDANQAMAGEDARAERSERAEAMDFLRDALVNGSESADDIKRQAKAAGISEITLRRARCELGVKTYKVGYPGVWRWALKANVISTDPRDQGDPDRARSGGVIKIEPDHPSDLDHDLDHLPLSVSKIEREQQQQQLTSSSTEETPNLITTDYARAREEDQPWR